MRLYLGTHEPSWLARSTVPLFVSVRRGPRFGRRPAVVPWALDSGGFTEVTIRGGWREEPSSYLDRAYALADRVGSPDWIAPQDWMCEPRAIRSTGLSVREHQERTVDNFCRLRELDERRLVIPVVQGWDRGDHERCVQMYADAGIDLSTTALVGLGSVCRRQGDDEIAAIVWSLARAGLRLHGFGVKTRGLAKYGQHLVSADSLAWSYRARAAAIFDEAPLCGRAHRSCSNCLPFAERWHEAIQSRPEQLDLFGVAS